MTPEAYFVVANGQRLLLSNAIVAHASLSTRTSISNVPTAVAASASRACLTRTTTVAASSVGLSRYLVMPVPTPNDDPLSGQWAGVMLKLDRTALTTKFVMALHDASIRNPTAWRRVSAIGARTGIKGAELDQVLAAAVAAGLVENRANNPSLVSLTNKGWLLARR